MKPAVTPRSRRLSFNITPMIDVVFQLIIFFLAASHLARIQSSEEVSLPKATQGHDAQSQQPHVVVTVTRDRGAYVSGRPVSLPQFEDLLLIETSENDSGRPLEVRFRVDERAAWGEFDPYLIACARAGITQVVYKVLPR